jgi:hypothetical protein
MRHSASSCFKTLTAGGGDGNKTSTCINAHFTGKTNPTPLMRRDCVPEPSNNIDYSLGKKCEKEKNKKYAPQRLVLFQDTHRRRRQQNLHMHQAHFTGKTNPTPPLMRRDCVPEPSNNIDYSLGKKVRKGKNMRHRNVSPVLLVE